MKLRNAEAIEVDRLARIWYDGWQDAHARILPAELARVRTLESFRERLQATLARVRVADVSGEAVGFGIIERDELYQLYVSATARGTGRRGGAGGGCGARLAAMGVDTAWLACAIGNDRAARFYEKCGWHRIGEVAGPLPMPDGGVLELQVWRYEKRLR